MRFHVSVGRRLSLLLLLLLLCLVRSLGILRLRLVAICKHTPKRHCQDCHECEFGIAFHVFLLTSDPAYAGSRGRQTGRTSRSRNLNERVSTSVHVVHSVHGIKSFTLSTSQYVDGARSHSDHRDERDDALKHQQHHGASCKWLGLGGTERRRRTE